MQIKLATARGVGYTGDAAGLRDPDTNLTYGIKYLAGAYRAANGDHNRAVRYYAGGYYYAAKQQRLERSSRPARQAPPKGVATSFNRGRRLRTASTSSQKPRRCRAQQQVPAPQVRVQTRQSRVDTAGHRPTLALFRGVLR